MINKIKKGMGFLIILIGLIIFFYPAAMEWRLNYETQKTIKEFNEKYHVTVNYADESNNKSLIDGYQEETTEENSNEKINRANDPLYQALYAYNQALIDNGQTLLDAWSYQQDPFDLEAIGMDSSVIGYIEIPDMDVTLALYLGASMDNLAKGAAILSQTSMPIGGESTNCVISGHRGYQGLPYFRNIELLEIGSMVYVTNPWETLAYQVTEIRIIEPNDIDAVLIQDGKDMVTLVTCHPYMSGGAQRYVVYCERVENWEPEENAVQLTNDSENKEDEAKENGQNDASQEETYSLSNSSKGLIKAEQAIRIIALVAIIICLFIIIRPKRKAKNQKSKEEQKK